MHNPYANIRHDGDLDDMKAAYEALERIHKRHAKDPTNCQTCPLVCVEPCLCLYLSSKVGLDQTEKAGRAE